MNRIMRPVGIEKPDEAVPNALTVKPFRLLWFNNIAFFLVANAQRFVFGWFVLEGLKRDPSDQGLVVFTLGLPAIFLTLHAGAWADRVDRRKLLIATQLAGAAIMAATAALIAADRATMSVVIGLTLAAGAATTIGQPVRSALIPALVPAKQLFSAIAVNALAMTVSMIIGPVVVQTVGNRFGFDGAFWFQAALMLLGVGFLLVLEIPGHENLAARRSVRHETADAVRHVWNDNALRTLFGLLIVASLTINPAIMVTVQAHVSDSLGLDAGDASKPLGLMGLGIAISSVIVMKKGNMANKGTAFQRAFICGATATFFIGRTTEMWQLLGMSFLMGLAGGFYITMNQGLIQSNTPQPLMGRVMALFGLTQVGFMPFGALLLGVISETTSTGLAISGAAVVAWLIVVTVYITNRDLRQLT